MEEKATALLDKTVLEDVAGKENVVTDPDLLEEYSRDSSFAAPRVPVSVIRPGSTGDIEKIMKAIRKSGVKVIPVSSGPPHFRGDTVPSVDNAAILDLSGLDEIEWINRRNRVACVYPGVTYAQLEAELEREGLRCMMPLLPRTTKSVVAACMEREPFTVPKYSWDLGDPVASSELTFGNGDTLRTGGGAGPGTLEQQRAALGAHKLPFGPLLIDPRKISQGSQGSISICSWLAIRCELLPEKEALYFTGAEKLEDLVELLYRELYLKLVDEQYILNSLAFASLLETDAKAIDQLRSKLPNWILVTSVGGYGKMAGEQFDWKDADLKDEAGRLGVKLETGIGGITADDYMEKVVRKSADPWWKIRYRGDVRELMFMTSATKTPEFTDKVMSMALKQKFDTQAIGVYIQMLQQGKSCQVSFDFQADADTLSGFQKTYTNIAAALFSEGAFYSRPYGPLADIVYSHGDYQSFVKYARGLKEIFDPEGVLNPGKLCF
ncbi:MAG: FAD-binding oxidoreductase [Actinobacteria bacterium]|nr:FAD-binding oxidoreductase [Actinomycetota bacterium]